MQLLLLEALGMATELSLKISSRSKSSTVAPLMLLPLLVASAHPPSGLLTPSRSCT